MGILTGDSSLDLLLADSALQLHHPVSPDVYSLFVGTLKKFPLIGCNYCSLTAA